MGWIRTWEGRHAILYPPAFPGECTNAMKFRFTTPAKAFAHMDNDLSGDVDEGEWRIFAGNLNGFLSQHGRPTMRVMSCWQEYD